MVKIYRNRNDVNFLVFEDGKFVVRDLYNAYVGNLPVHLFHTYYNKLVDYNTTYIQYVDTELARNNIGGLNNSKYYLLSPENHKLFSLKVASQLETNDYDKWIY